MINKFTSTVFDPNQKEIARVNRTDGTSLIWKCTFSLPIRSLGKFLHQNARLTRQSQTAR
jgi:hypothetical protein